MEVMDGNSADRQGTIAQRRLEEFQQRGRVEHVGFAAELSDQILVEIDAEAIGNRRPVAERGKGVRPLGRFTVSLEHQLGRVASVERLGRVADVAPGKPRLVFRDQRRPLRIETAEMEECQRFSVDQIFARVVAADLSMGRFQ